MREITPEEMDEIGTRHDIHPRFRVDFLKLANEGRIDNRQFGLRLHVCSNYQQACQEIMELLSLPLRPLFADSSPQPCFQATK